MGEGDGEGEGDGGGETDGDADGAGIGEGCGVCATKAANRKAIATTGVAKNGLGELSERIRSNL